MLVGIFVNKAFYFTDQVTCARVFDDLLLDDKKLYKMSNASRMRFNEAFQWHNILEQYEKLLLNFLR